MTAMPAPASTTPNGMSHGRALRSPSHPNSGWMMADAKFDEAEALADDDAVLERVRRSRMQVKYCKLFNMSLDDPQRAAACEAFFQEVRHFGFTRIREWKPLEMSFEEIRKGIFQ